MSFSRMTGQCWVFLLQRINDESLGIGDQLDLLVAFRSHVVKGHERFVLVAEMNQMSINHHGDLLICHSNCLQLDL